MEPYTYYGDEQEKPRPVQRRGRLAAGLVLGLVAGAGIGYLGFSKI